MAGKGPGKQHRDGISMMELFDMFRMTRPPKIDSWKHDGRMESDAVTVIATE